MYPISRYYREQPLGMLGPFALVGVAIVVWAIPGTRADRFCSPPVGSGYGVERLLVPDRLAYELELSSDSLRWRHVKGQPE